MWVSYRKGKKIRNAFITVTTFNATHDVGRQIKAVQEKDSGEVSGRRLEREKQ